MSFAEGEIVSGKVTSITKFGAFVALEGGKSGLVHISEIADTYVSDVHQFLSEGQEVKVKILPTDKVGRINLSIKKAVAPAAPQESRPQQPRSAAPRAPQPRTAPPPVEMPAPRAPQPRTAPPPVEMPAPRAASANDSFEEKLRAFMKDSESKMSSMKNPPEKKQRRMRMK